jgi:hypothetical protein
MELLAHFTLADAPGTLAIYLLGFGLALALTHRWGWTAFFAIAAMSCFALLGFFADTYAWPDRAKLAIDVLFLTCAVSLAVGLWQRRLRWGQPESDPR